MQRQLPDIPFQFERTAVLLERESVGQMPQAAHAEAMLLQVLSRWHQTVWLLLPSCRSI